MAKTTTIMTTHRKISPINRICLTVVWLSALVWTVANGCNVDMCSREYGSILSVPHQQLSTDSSSESVQQFCSLLFAYQHCLRSISRSCRGNLEFHTLQTLLKNWKNDKNCNQTSSQPINIKTMVPPHHRKAIPSLISPTNSNWKPSEDKIELQEKLQTCLSAAYNFTINGNNNSVDSVADERTRLLNSDHKGRRNKASRPNRNRRTRDVSSKFVPISGETVDLSNEEEVDNNDFEPSPSPVPTLRPLMPPSPPLTCIIYGDPHLRTLNNEYQTCRCSGAWPLIDHPLFAVQITNSRVKGSSPQIFGVTKVTVLVRQFSKCGIFNDLIYEADSQSTPGQYGSLPSAQFIDGSTSNSNNLIRITQSNNNNVITIHLDHIGVRIYIGQFESSYLNVVIKFRSATSTVKQQLVLNSISDNSLCKTGCPKRETIDIQTILKATGVDISANPEDSAQPSDNSETELKSDSSVIDNNEETTDDQSETADQESDPCQELNGYYRISCLYDKSIKGAKHIDVDNAYRFAQSFDEKRFIDNSIVNVNSVTHYDSNQNHNNAFSVSPNHCFNSIHVLLIVIYLLINHL